MTEEVEAHSGEVWSLCLTHDKRGLVTGSSDKTVKFWNFELMSTGTDGTKQLSLVHVRTLQLEEGVVGVACSGDSRLPARLHRQGLLLRHLQVLPLALRPQAARPRH